MKTIITLLLLLPLMVFSQEDLAFNNLSVFNMDKVIEEKPIITLFDFNENETFLQVINNESTTSFHIISEEYTQMKGVLEDRLYYKKIINSETLKKQLLIIDTGNGNILISDGETYFSFYN